MLHDVLPQGSLSKQRKIHFWLEAGKATRRQLVATCYKRNQTKEYTNLSSSTAAG